MVEVRGCAVVLVLVLVTVGVASAKGPCVCGSCVSLCVDEGARGWLSVRRVGVIVVVGCVVVASVVT